MAGETTVTMPADKLFAAFDVQTALARENIAQREYITQLEAALRSATEPTPPAGVAEPAEPAQE